MHQMVSFNLVSGSNFRADSGSEVLFSISGSIILLLTWLHDCSTYYDNYVYCATCNEIFDRKSFDSWPIGRHMLSVCLAYDPDGWILWCVIITLKNIFKIVICQIEMIQSEFENFWCQIWNLLENWVRMMYRWSWLMKVKCSQNVAEI